MFYGHSEHDESLVHCEPLAHYVLILPMPTFSALNFRVYWLCGPMGPFLYHLALPIT